MQSWLTIIGGVLMAIVVYELLRRQVLKRAALKIRGLANERLIVRW